MAAPHYVTTEDGMDETCRKLGCSAGHGMLMAMEHVPQNASCTASSVLSKSPNYMGDSLFNRISRGSPRHLNRQLAGVVQAQNPT